MDSSDFLYTGDNLCASLSGSCTYRAPSNIALVKYWGKYGLQLPKNPSLSFTLSACSTITTLSFTPQQEKGAGLDFTVRYEGRPAPSFSKKIQLFFERIEPYVPFIKHYKFIIDTKNSFPHSSGIASSASGMAALALCIMEMEKQLSSKRSHAFFLKKAGFLARLGSGSAARSIQGPVMFWGEHPEVTGSSNEYAVKNSFLLHPQFKNYRDSILIVDKGKKQVSSSLGHRLMNNHPFAESRFRQAAENMTKLLSILQLGHLEDFAQLVEEEALSLHAMMMTSTPSYLLMKPQTLQIINAVREYRKETAVPVCFTLDAGANVHLLYPEDAAATIRSFIEERLKDYCEDEKYINDQLGCGAQKLA